MVGAANGRAGILLLEMFGRRQHCFDAHVLISLIEFCYGRDLSFAALSLHTLGVSWSEGVSWVRQHGVYDFFG